MYGISEYLQVIQFEIYVHRFHLKGIVHDKTSLSLLSHCSLLRQRARQEMTSISK